MNKRFFPLMLIIWGTLSFMGCRSFIPKPSGNDWPEYMGDNHNSGFTKETLSFPLAQKWRSQNIQKPSPAWGEPAQRDVWHYKPKLASLITYDRAYQVVSADGLVFYASSSEDKIQCLDLLTGEEKWHFDTQGPNRVAPVFSDGKLFVGSDDGWFYCLEAYTGRLLWNYCAYPESKRVPGNGRLISLHPVRIGATVRGDSVLFTAGLFPEEGIRLVALDANTGDLFWQKEIGEVQYNGKTYYTCPQGYPVSNDSLLFIPNSRVQPLGFDLKSGDLKYVTGGSGGDYLSITSRNLAKGVSNATDIYSDDFLEAALNGHRVVETDSLFFVATHYEITAVSKGKDLKLVSERKRLRQKLKLAQIRLKELGPSLASSDLLDSIQRIGTQLKSLRGQEFLWQKPVPVSYGMVVCPNALIVGLENEVRAFHRETGEIIWQAKVKGKAYSLAMARGRLLVSTDKGYIYCFGKAEGHEFILPVKEARNPFTKTQPEILQMVENLQEYCGTTKGWALFMGLQDGQLPYQWLKASGMKTVVLSHNKKKVRKGRNLFRECGDYGDRISMFHGELSDLNPNECLFNMVVMPERGGFIATNQLVEELSKVMVPDNGYLVIHHAIGGDRLLHSTFPLLFKAEKVGEWVIFKRKPLEGVGSWTHQYADISKTNSSEDQLVTENNVIQWFGGPGPREMADRHYRAPAPLVNKGVVMIPRQNGVMAVDAFNGAVLWKHDLIDFRRLTIFRDAGNMALTDDLAYAVAGEFCYAYHLRTGEKVFTVRPSHKVPFYSHWGYVGTTGNILLGTVRRPAAVYKYMDNANDWGHLSRLVTAPLLFAKDRHTGKDLWHYKSKGVIVHPTICANDSVIWFLESEEAGAKGDRDGLVPLEDLIGKSTRVVALDIHSGEKIWEKSFADCNARNTLHFSFSEGELVITGCRNYEKTIWYDLWAWNAKTGDRIWHKTFKYGSYIGANHGEQIKHPAVTNGKVYAEPFMFDLKTGEQTEDWRLVRGGWGCGNICSSGDLLFFRASNPALCDPNQTDEGSRLNHVSRAGCWINIIPANGLIVIPEASAGCTCSFPLQMSVTYRSVRE